MLFILHDGSAICISSHFDWFPDLLTINHPFGDGAMRTLSSLTLWVFCVILGFLSCVSANRCDNSRIAGLTCAVKDVVTVKQPGLVAKDMSGEPRG